MSGRLDLRTPWARKYITPEDAAILQDLVPEGVTVRVGARFRPGEWTLTYLRGTDEVARTTSYGRDLPRLVRWFISRHA